MDTALKETMNSITKGEKTFDPKSFAESFRENLLNVSKKVSEIPSRTSIPTPNVKELNIPSLNVSSVSTVTNSFSFWSIFKFILAMLFITILALNVYSFVTEGVDAYSYMFNSKPESQEKELTLNQDEKDSGEDDTAIDVAAEKISKENKKNPTELEKVMENSENNVKNSLETNVVEQSTNNYKANNVSLNAKSKAGYCYAGSDRGVRTCVQVGEDDVCMSGEIYPSLDLCVNPNLKN
tara:strand:- start:1199 stop:1912 length:714 start_codon:yes stop_codon:yes gene_type:complete